MIDNRPGYGADMQYISTCNSIPELQRMLTLPKYANSGLSLNITARIQALRTAQASATAEKPQPPTVIAQAMQPSQQAQAPAPQQGYAEGGGIRGFSNNGWARNRMRMNAAAHPVAAAARPAPLTPAQTATNTFNTQVSQAQQNMQQKPGAAPPTTQGQPVGATPNAQSVPVGLGQAGQAAQQMAPQAGQPPRGGMADPNAHPGQNAPGTQSTGGMLPQQGQPPQGMPVPPVMNNRMSQNMVAPLPAIPKMAKGGIVAFKHGGKVRKFANGGLPDDTDPYTGESVSGRQYLANLHANPPPTPLTPAQIKAQNDANWAQVTSDPKVAAIIAQHTKGPKPPASGVASLPVAAAPGSVSMPAGWKNPPPLTPSDMLSVGYGSGNGGRNTVDKPQAFAELYGQAQKAINGDPNDKDSQAYATAQDRKISAGNRSMALPLALMTLGTGMMGEAGRHPNNGLLGNLGDAAAPAIQAYTKQADQADAQDLALTQEQRKQNQAIGIMSTQEAAAQQRANASANRAEQHDRMLMAMQNKPWMMNENNIRALSASLAKQDNYQKPQQEYDLLARQKYTAANSQYAASADAREEINSASARAKFYNDEYTKAYDATKDDAKANAAATRALAQRDELFGNKSGGATPAGGTPIAMHPSLNPQG